MERQHDVVYSSVFELFEALAFECIPAACDMESTNDIFAVRFGRVNSLFECFKFGCGLAIPGEKQAICPCFDASLRARRIDISKFDDQCGGTWLRRGLAFSYKTHATAALRPAHL